MNVAVFGAGTMGHALALVFALGGHKVRLTDNNKATLDRAPALMAMALATLREAGESDWTDGHLAQAVTRHATVAETLDGAELIVEAVVERPEVKRALFAEIDALARPDVIIASNTSHLDIFPLVPEGRQARTLIAHWYTPPYLVDLVDIVGSDRTDPAVIATMRDIVTAMGKVPVVMRRFISGYIANRIQAAIGAEVQKLLDEGYADPKDIDDAVIHGLALRMPIVGVMAKADFTGLALHQELLKHKTYEPPPVRDRSPILDRLVAEGRTGVLAGRGYFDWGGRPPEELFRDRDRKLLALKRALRDIGRMEGK
ncbi:MAG TPA: 3-hydroxyacyl-CoA dehydrogenase family protein [Acetobacteraceae bacterium]|jgi:3-hydroxybutyryl-CoA dehydrogenase|nr:3-hydroxyacyl-CoA dehydrogenase family protein [Acetobacteraceae bacterium]